MLSFFNVQVSRQKIWKTQNNTLYLQHLISAHIGRSRYLHYKKDARRLLHGSLLCLSSVPIIPFNASSYPFRKLTNKASSVAFCPEGICCGRNDRYGNPRHRQHRPSPNHIRPGIHRTQTAPSSYDLCSCEGSLLLS